MMERRNLWITGGVSRRMTAGYMEWMKNLSLFHQMREKGEDGRAKDKLEDYKMQIVRSLMEKNKMMEEIEQKLVRMEEGDDPVQQKILEKIAHLEQTVTQRGMVRKAAGANESKMNQMMDYMMYNMSVLQQMVTNVAQMQRTQYEHNQETNRVIQSLPQILTHSKYQGGNEVSEEHLNKSKRSKPDMVHTNDVEAKGNKLNSEQLIRQARKNTKNINPGQSINHPDRSANKKITKLPSMGSKPQIFVHSPSERNIEQNQINSNPLVRDRSDSDELATPPKNLYKSTVEDLASKKKIVPDSNLIITGKNTGIIDSNQFRISRMRSGDIDSKSKVVQPAISSKRVDTMQKAEEDQQSKDSSVFKYTQEGDSLKNRGNPNLPNAPLSPSPLSQPPLPEHLANKPNPEESVVMSEGGNNSVDKTKGNPHRNESRMMSDGGYNRGANTSLPNQDTPLNRIMKKDEQNTFRGMEGQVVLEDDKLNHKSPHRPSSKPQSLKAYISKL